MAPIGPTVIFTAALICGTACSIFSKVLLDVKGEWLDGTEHAFTEPLFQTLGMFAAMLIALPARSLKAWWSRPKSHRRGCVRRCCCDYPNAGHCIVPVYGYLFMEHWDHLKPGLHFAVSALLPAAA